MLTLLTASMINLPIYAAESMDDYLDLPIEDLLSMEVTSVSKKKQRLTEAAAAIYVITQEDIRRSGVTSIPEALRMAPGLHVAKMDSNKWAISSRGFSSQFANKLLVLIDGRSVYTPSYSGVYWEIQDTMLEDIDRIEVIRGPGATLWGANAVNGVINIITKAATESQGGLLVAGAGNEEKAFASLRYGTELGADTHGRIYVKYNDRDSSYAPELDDEAGDDWQALRAGFRLDSTVTDSDRWTLQGDIYDTEQNQIVRQQYLDPFDPANNPPDFSSPYLEFNLPDEFEASGWNLLGRWEHDLSEDSTTSLQIYYDHTEREELILGQTHDILDLDFQHQFSPLAGHDLVWGLGYRRIKDDFDNTFNVSVLPDSQTNSLTSAFVQDEIKLLDERVRLTLGTKYEHNDYTGSEVQPSARLLWLPQEGHSVWTSISRAMRTPSRVEDSGILVTGVLPALSPTDLPKVITTNGSDSFDSEELTAIELGYRVQPSESVSLDLALFYNKYKNLNTFEITETITSINPLDPFGPPLVLPSRFEFANLRDATSRGGELSLDWRLDEWWRLQANYSYLQISADNHSDSNDSFSEAVVEEASPKHQLSIRSAMDLSNAWSLDLWVYYADELGSTSYSLGSDAAEISEYISLNVRLAWRPSEQMELSLVGRDLLDNRHPEFNVENFITRTEVERSIYGQIRWDF